MKVGINTYSIDATELTEMGKRSEDAGLESIWVSDHLVVPAEISSDYPHDKGLPVGADTPLFDPWAVLSAIAAVTEKVRLGTWIFILPARHHLVTARAVATLDLISEGRAVLGVGTGWLREEIEAAGFPWKGRIKRTEEGIEAMRVLWSEPIAELRGEQIDLPPVYFEPKPPQGGALPIHLGGESDKAMERAARLGDGWMGVQADPRQAAERVRRVGELREEAGVEGPFETTTGTNGPIDPQLYAEYEESGVDRIIVSPWYAGVDWREVIDRIGETLAVAAH